MRPATTAISARLRSSLGEPVVVRRRGAADGEDETLVVVAVMEEWIAFQRLTDGFNLDDVVLLRLNQITEVGADPNSARVRRVLAGIGVPVAEFPCPSDVSDPGLLELVAQRARRVRLHHHEPQSDHRWDEVVAIRAVASERILVHHMDSALHWAPEPGARPIRCITRIEFGGRHLASAERRGGEAPARRTHEEPDVYREWFRDGR